MVVLICCDKVIEHYEEGVNGTDFYKCEECGGCYNVATSVEA